VLLLLDPHCDQDFVCAQVEEHIAAKGLTAELRLAAISTTGARDTFQLSASAAR
jgi:hypothetical protein